jgi:poly(glycerol-phosphate) alpha-glucosyltransferase
MYPSVVATAWSGNQKPYIVSPHGMLDPWALNNSRWKKRISALLYENRHLRGACCIHALNHAEAESVRAYGLKNPICIIPNGVELPPLTGQRTSQSTHTLLYLGRLHPKKGLPKLLEAWSLVQKEANNSRWRLVIAGWDQNGHQRDLEKLAAMLNIGSSISFVGPMFGEAKAASFSGASAFILPSLSEGLPMTVLEAWSWGLPVLMTPKCNLPEGEAAEAAIMMEADSTSISTALRRLFSMSELERESMGKNGRRLVGEQFQWPHLAKQMCAVYDWILGLGPKPSCVID